MAVGRGHEIREESPTMSRPWKPQFGHKHARKASGGPCRCFGQKRSPRARAKLSGTGENGEIAPLRRSCLSSLHFLFGRDEIAQRQSLP
ncbi:hypothetical protein V6N13_102905 [Hibiscus sabdariffa]|uniref:Uncharacterized protein n=1 Tax=Hibiscus sabdariffa TaxID=183260 RepID=A0ABR2D5I7_9ROSI